MLVNTRKAILEDIGALIKARFDYFAAENWDVSESQHEIIEDSLRKYFSKYLNTDFFAFFTEVDAKIASVAFLAISNKPASLAFPTGKTGTVYNVLTYPEYRKKGFAAATMNLLLQQAKNEGLSYIELSSSASGKNLYKTLGFIETIPSEHFTEMRLSLL